MKLIKTHKCFVGFIASIVIYIGFLGCRQDIVAQETPVVAITMANNEFAISLYTHLVKESGNFAFSPVSINASLSMLYLGAQAETAAEIGKVLKLPPNTHAFDLRFSDFLKNLNRTHNNVIIVNSLWKQADIAFNPSFCQAARDQFGALVNNINFRESASSVCQRINDYVADQNGGRIQDLVRPNQIHTDTKLILVNSFLFKGKWQMPFNKQWTARLPFRLANGEAVSVLMMKQVGIFGYVETKDFQMLEIKYSGEGELPGDHLRSNRFSMVVLLPKSVDGLLGIEHSITVRQLNELRNEEKAVALNVSLPKFKITCEVALEKILRDMGMNKAFSESEADFSGMSDQKPLFVDVVQHKAQVSVDEDGTEAAAATVISLTHSAVDPSLKVFNADHQFLFFILDDQSDLILFLGRVEKPQGF